jgi:hypothetical protein
VATQSEKFRQAAFTYFGIAILVIFLTIFLGGTPERKAGEVRSVIPGVIVIGILSILIYKEYHTLTRILTILAGIRTLFFLLNFLGFQLGYDFRTHAIRFSAENLFTFNYLYLILALLTGFILYMLARAGWDF